MTRTIRAIVSFVLLACAAATASAQDWSGAGANNNWSTPANWVGGVAPFTTPATVVTFGAAGTTFTPVADTPWTLGRIDITGATPYSITGGALTLGGFPSVIDVSGATHSLGNDFTFSAPTTFATSSDLLYSGAMSGAAAVVKSGAGRLVLSNASALNAVGPFTVNGGVLQVGNGASAPSFLPPNVVNNATIEFVAGAVPQIAVPGGLTGTGNIVISSGRVNSFGPPLTYAGSTTLTGSGSILSGTVTSNGALVIGAGARVDAVDSTFGSLAGAGDLFSLGSGVTVGGDGTTSTFSGTLGGGSAPFTKAGPGRLIMTNTNPTAAFGSAAFTVAGGVLQVGDATSAPAFLPPNVVNNATIDFDASSVVEISLPLGLTGTGSVVVSAGRVNALGPALTYAGSTTVLGTGTILSGTVTNNGALFVGAGARLDAVSSTFGSLAGTGEVVVVTSLSVGGDHTDTTFSGAINGGGTLNKSGTGTLTLSGVIAPSTVVQGGGLILTGTAAAITINPGATFGGTGTVNGTLAINEAAALRIGIEGTTPVTQHDHINVAVGVAVGEAMLLLTGGYVPVVGDAFTIVTNNGFNPVTGTFAGLPEGGTLVFNGATMRVSYVGGNGNDITLTAISSTALAWNGAGADNNWGTAANWSGGLAPPSAATTFMAFPGASARFAPVVDSPWTINRLDIAAPTPYAISGQAITFAGTTPRLASSGASHGISAPVTLAAPLTVSNTSPLTLSGAIGGAAGLTKAAAGVLTLSGSGIYAGPTMVAAGSLLVDGTIAGTVQVASGGTLGGTGTIGGAVAVAAGGTLSPGVATGIVNTGDLALAGTLLVEIQGTTPGTQYDRANVTGAVTLSGTLSLTGSFVPAPGDTFTLVTNDGADAVSGTFNGLPEGATFGFNGSTLRITYVGGTGNDVVLTAVTLASTTWSGGGLDPNWSTGANWVGGTAPASAGATFVTFGPSARYGASVDAPWTINRIDIGGAPGYVIAGQPLTFGGAAPQLNLSGATHTISNDVTIASGPLSLTTSVDFAYGGVLSGSGGLIKAGAGRLVVSNVAGLQNAGPITVNGGVLQVGNGASAPSFLPPNVVNNATIEFVASAVTQIDVPGGLTGTGNVVVSSGRMNSFGPALTYAGSTTLTGAGTIMAATVTNNGALHLGAGTRLDAIDSTFGSLAGSGEVVALGATFNVGGDGTTTTFNGTIVGGATFIKDGPGRLIMTNPTAPTAFGSSPFIVAGGVLQVGDGTSAPAFVPPNVVNNATIDFVSNVASQIDLPAGLTGTGNVVVSAGRLNGFGPALTYGGSTTLLGIGTIMAATVTNNGALYLGAGTRMDALDSTFGSLAGSGQLVALGAGFTAGGDNTNTTFSGTVAGGAPISKTGFGVLTLTNANPLAGFGGTFTISGGVLRIGNGTTGPSFLPANITNNATLEFAGSGTPVAVPAGLTGTGNLLVSGGQVDALGPALSHAGSTTVTGTSTLIGSVVNNGPLVIDAGARMDTLNSTVGSLAGGGALAIGGAGITLGGDGTSTTFSGSLEGSGPLVKTGAGVLTLSGTSTHNGNKSIDGGALMLTGTIPGAILVNAGGTFGGTGTVLGIVTVNGGGTLAPGLSPGIINTGDLAVNGALAIEIQGATLGTQYDNVNVTGTVTIAGGTLALTGAYVPVAGDVFTIVTNDAADAVAGTFTGLAEGTTFSFNGSTLRISYIGGTGNDITLTAISTTALVWNGAGANDNWSTAPNWVVGLAPVSGATTFLTFPAASARFAPIADAAFTVNRIHVTGTTTYSLSGQAITFDGITPQLNTSGGAHALSNPLTLSAGLVVTNDSALTLSGPIGGPAGLTKSGTGALTLSGVGSHAGGTTVSAGTLLVTGTIPGPVNVTGGTLGGTGVIAGAVSVQAAATLAPGLSPGILNTGDLNLAGATLMEIEGATLGTQYDNINVTGSVTIAGPLTLAGAYVPAAGDRFTILTNDGADPVVGTFAGLPEGATIVLNGRPLAITYAGGNGNDVVLLAPAAAAFAVPTLSQWALVLLAMLLAGMGALQTRRQSPRA